MMKFMHALMKRAELLRAQDGQMATGTYADGMFPLSCEEALEARTNRMRLSYQKDVLAALSLKDRPPVYG